jgi:RNA polymerase sigma factor (sigma-70 family)
VPGPSGAGSAEDAVDAEDEDPADGPAGDVADLYVSRRDRLRRLAYLMTGHQEAAEEIVHDAFARVQRRWASIDSPAAYVRAAVVNLCLNWRRHAAIERERTPRPRRTDSVVSPPEIDETWDVLARLPRDQRVAVVLRYYEDLPVDAIAHAMDCPAATVRTRIHRALSKLRQEMMP